MDEVKYYMEESILSIDADASVLEAAKKMRNNKVGSLLVNQKETYAGVITEGDLTRKVIAEDLSHKETKVSDVMSTPIISVDYETSMVDTFFRMRQNNIRHIAITEKKEIVGVLSLKDFATYYINKYAKDNPK